MQPNIKFYKIVLLNSFLQQTSRARTRLLNEIAVNATDPVLYQRRFRMLGHVSQYENQIIKKIQDFETNDVNDLTLAKLGLGLEDILNRNA
jgi:hypothetical protein